MLLYVLTNCSFASKFFFKAWFWANRPILLIIFLLDIEIFSCLPYNFAINVQILGVSEKAEKDEIVKAVMELKNSEIEDGYTADIVRIRQVSKACHSPLVKTSFFQHLSRDHQANLDNILHPLFIGYFDGCAG